jgi:hypothetical protein
VPLFEEYESVNEIIQSSAGPVVVGGDYPELSFHTCGVISMFGPTQAQVNAAYAGTPLAGMVTVAMQGVQDWTVPEEGLYLIRAVGAAGGAGGYNLAGLPGYGVYITGNVYLTAGTVLRIVCGQRGTNATAANTQYIGGGGGGMSFITRAASTSEPLICAGGGGGGSQLTSAVQHANTGTSGNAGYGGGAGGTNGGGGGQGSHTSGGGGYKTNGVANTYAKQGLSFLAGTLAGGTIYSGSNAGYGGFGGGSAGYAGGGAGGGYSGGGGGGYTGNGSKGGCGGGGGSYVHSLVLESTLTAGIGTADGYVRIQMIEPKNKPVSRSLIIRAQKSIRL